MLLSAFPQALVLTGPTGSGKSRLALDWAARLDAEIVSMDSMALYRRMDIATAKPTADERRQVRHHLLDVLDAWESASVAWWLQQAEQVCRDIVGRGKIPLFVGGTPLYLQALLRGLFEGPPADEALRRRLSEEAALDGGAALHARLGGVDALSAARLHPHDVRRVVRALEVWELTGKPLSAWQTQWTRAGADSMEARCLCLDLPRAELYTRIDARVEQMLAAGLVDEARHLRALEQPLSREASQALGYKDTFDYLDGRVDLKEMVRRIQTHSRQFAKRQMTWFRRLPVRRLCGTELTIAGWPFRMNS